MNYLAPILLGLVFVGADLGLGGMFGFSTIRPSFVLPFVVYMSLKRGAVFGTIAGFLVGLAEDMVGGIAMGSTSLALALSGFIPGRFWSTGPFRVHWPWGVFLLICSLLFEAIRHLILSREIGSAFGLLFVSSGVPSALYTVVLGVVWFLSPLNRDRVQ